MRDTIQLRSRILIVLLVGILVSLENSGECTNHRGWPYRDSGPMGDSLQEETRRPYSIPFRSDSLLE